MRPPGVCNAVDLCQSPPHENRLMNLKLWFQLEKRGWGPVTYDRTKRRSVRNVFTKRTELKVKISAVSLFGNDRGTMRSVAILAQDRLNVAFCKSSMGRDTSTAAAILTGVVAAFGSFWQGQQLGVVVEKTAEACTAYKNLVPPEVNSCPPEFSAATDAKLWLPVYAAAGFLVGVCFAVLRSNTRGRERVSVGPARLASEQPTKVSTTVVRAPPRAVPKAAVKRSAVRPSGLAASAVDISGW